MKTMMRTTKLLLGCTLSLVLASPGLSSDRKKPDVERRSTNACSAVQVTAPDAPPATKRRAKKKLPTFSASAILDLKLEAAVKGEHQVEFKIYTPNGHLYQSLTAEVSAPEAKEGRRHREAKNRTASATLPVAGTTIVNSSLYGEWMVEAFLDGKREVACAKPLSFAIEP
jgi:hypothetical protein